MYNRSEDQTLLKLIDNAIQDSVAHNFSEEALMHKLQTQYPEIEPHILEHRLMVKELLDLRGEIQSSITASQLEYKRLLRKWQDHLFKYDKGFIDLLLKESIEEEPEDDDKQD